MYTLFSSFFSNQNALCLRCIRLFRHYGDRVMILCHCRTVELPERKKNKLKYLHMFTLIDNQSKCTTLPCCTIEGGAAGWYLVIKTALTVSLRSIPKM